MSLKRTLKKLSYSFRSQEQKFISKTLCGVELKVLDGTIRKQEDQDDAWWFYLAKHHTTIYDIGCNVGYTALLALITDPHKRMILVDPNASALQKAAINIIENHLGSQVSYVSAFVGDTVDDTVKFYTIGTGAAGSMYASHAQTAASVNSFQEVKTLTLDFLLDHYAVHPDLVKIDVEGAETMAMTAAKRLARTSQCSFFIEMHTVENVGMEQAVQHMLDWCKDMEYKAWYLKTGEELITPDILKQRGKCHLLLMPNHKEYPDYLKGVAQNAPLPNSI